MTKLNSTLRIMIPFIAGVAGMIFGYHMVNYNQTTILCIHSSRNNIARTINRLDDRSDSHDDDDLHEIYRQLRTHPNRTNLTTELESRWLYYNRMTKTGSRTLTNIIDVVSTPHLKVYQDFHPYSQDSSSRGKITELERILSVASEIPPFLVSGDHMHINYRDHGVNQPISFSLIRDPVDRYISQFHWIRNGDEHGANSPGFKRISVDMRERTLDECVAMATSENPAQSQIALYCGGELHQQTRRFCGYDERCSNTDFALKKALANLEDYLVVGIYERYGDFVDVLEQLLPHLLPGMMNQYRNVTVAYHAKYSTTAKEVPKDETMATLRLAAKTEYMFYEKAKANFQKLILQLEHSDSR